MAGGGPFHDGSVRLIRLDYPLPIATIYGRRVRHLSDAEPEIQPKSDIYKRMNTSSHLRFLSQYRSCIMGIAILLIMLYHYHPWPIPGDNLIGAYGMLGVDVFLFVSGFGCYYSLSKDPQAPARHFYMRRFIRILPASIIAGLLLIYPFRGHGIYDLLLSAMGLNTWYIRTILILYLATPFLLRYFKRHHASYCSFLALSIVVIMATMLLHWLLIPHFSVFHPLTQTVTWTLARYHAYALGLFLPLRVSMGMQERNWAWATSICLLSIPAFLWRACGISLPSQINYYTAILAFPLYLPALVALLVLFCRNAHYIPGRILSLLNWLGAHSLEIYLVHVTILHAMCLLHIPVGMTILKTASIALSLVVAHLLQRLCAMITPHLATFTASANRKQ